MALRVTEWSKYKALHRSALSPRHSSTLLHVPDSHCLVIHESFRPVKPSKQSLCILHTHWPCLLPTGKGTGGLAFCFSPSSLVVILNFLPHFWDFSTELFELFSSDQPLRTYFTSRKDRVKDISTAGSPSLLRSPKHRLILRLVLCTIYNVLLLFFLKQLLHKRNESECYTASTAGLTAAFVDCTE